MAIAGSQNADGGNENQINGNHIPQPSYKVRREEKALVPVTAEQLAGHPILNSPRKGDANGNVERKATSTEDLLKRLENL